MPATLPIRIPGARRSFPAIALLLIGAALGGCSGGDFFRTRQDMRSDDMHKWLGAEVTGSVGMKASQFQLTDNERLLRDLAYPLIEPPLSRPAWKSVWGDYKPLPSPWRQVVVFDRTMYGRNLIDEPHRSHMSRYSVLIDDVRSDITRFEPFYTAAARVLELDRKRNASLKMVSELSPREQRRRGRAHGGELVHRAMGAAGPGTPHLVLPLGAGAFGDPGAGRDCRRCRPPGQGTRRALRQSAGASRWRGARSRW